MKEREGVLVTGARGRIFTAKVGSDAVYFYFEGHIDVDMFEPSMGTANALTTAGGARLFGDGENWKTYASGYRDAWTRWFVANRTRIAHTDLVVKSPILRMGVQVVNLFVPKSITSLARSEELYAKLRAHVPRIREATAEWPADIAERVRGR